MYCGEFVKTLIGPCYHRPKSQLNHLYHHLYLISKFPWDFLFSEDA